MSNFGEVVYDDASVAALLFATAAFGTPGFSFTPEAETFLGEYLGYDGREAALTLHARALAPRDPEPIPAPSHFTFESPEPFKFALPHVVPSPLDHPRLSESPTTTRITAPTTTTPTTTQAVPPVPTPTVLGKRKAAHQPGVPPADKKQRGKQPKSYEMKTCRWGGCGDIVCAADSDEHMKEHHSMSTAKEHKERFTWPMKCLWSGCTPDRRTPKGFSNPTALLKHLRDAHFHGIHFPCLGCGKLHRWDKLRTHVKVCKRYIDKMRMEQENHGQ